MKRNILAILFCIISTTPLSGHAADKVPTSPEAGGRTNAQNYKDMVLAICLADAYENEPAATKDIGSSVGALRNWASYDWEKNPEKVSLLVKKYLARSYFNPLVESEVKGVQFNFLKCLDLYHSKELEAQVKRVVLNPTHTYRQDNSPPLESE
jgi:hypothetical protein